MLYRVRKEGRGYVIEDIVWYPIIHLSMLLMTSTLIMQLWPHVISTTCFYDRICASKKGGIGGVGQVSAMGAVHVSAALAA